MTKKIYGDHPIVGFTRVGTRHKILFISHGYTANGNMKGAIYLMRCSNGMPSLWNATWNLHEVLGYRYNRRLQYIVLNGDLVNTLYEIAYALRHARYIPEDASIDEIVREWQANVIRA